MYGIGRGGGGGGCLGNGTVMVSTDTDYGEILRGPKTFKNA